MVGLKPKRSGGTVNGSEADSPGIWVAGRSTSITRRQDRCQHNSNVKRCITYLCTRLRSCMISACGGLDSPEFPKCAAVTGCVLQWAFSA